MLRPSALVVMITVAAAFGLAQPPAKPEFEAVSIRPGSGRPTAVNGMLIVGMLRGGQDLA